MSLAQSRFRKVFGKEVHYKAWHCCTCFRARHIDCNSMAALAYAKDPKYHGKTKYIDIRYHFICDMVAQKEMVLKHISTSRMVVDPN